MMKEIKIQGKYVFWYKKQIKTPLSIDYHDINLLNITKWIFFLVQRSGIALTIDMAINDAAFPSKLSTDHYLINVLTATTIEIHIDWHPICYFTLDITVGYFTTQAHWISQRHIYICSRFSAIPIQHVYFHSLYFNRTKHWIFHALIDYIEQGFEHTFRYILMSIDVYIGRGVVWTARATWRVKKTSSL